MSIIVVYIPLTILFGFLPHLPSSLLFPLSLHDALPIFERATRNSLALAEQNGLRSIAFPAFGTGVGGFPLDECARVDRKSTRLNSSHLGISYAVFCLKKKNK